MDFEHLLVTRHDAVACVSLNRPSAMNALSMALRHSIVATVDAFYATSFGDGMKLEAQATKRWASGLTQEQLAARGAGAVSRGRGQR